METSWNRETSKAYLAYLKAQKKPPTEANLKLVNDAKIAYENALTRPFQTSAKNEDHCQK